MHCGTASEMVAKFSAAYEALKEKKSQEKERKKQEKEKKDQEKVIAMIAPMILSAKTDDISDGELIDLINSLGLREKFYPAKLKELRSRLVRSEQNESPVSAEHALRDVALPVHPCVEALESRISRVPS